MKVVKDTKSNVLIWRNPLEEMPERDDMKVWWIDGFSGYTRNSKIRLQTWRDCTFIKEKCRWAYQVLPIV